MLRGSEVKSLRDGKVQIAEAFARIDGNEVWLHQLHDRRATSTRSRTPATTRPASASCSSTSHEIERLKARVDPEHLSLIPLSIYFKDGRAKVELALARGRKTHDKRQAIAERDAARDLARANRGDKTE